MDTLVNKQLSHFLLKFYLSSKKQTKILYFLTKILTFSINSNASWYMLRKGPVVVKGILDFVEDFFFGVKLH